MRENLFDNLQLVTCKISGITLDQLWVSCLAISTTLEIFKSNKKSNPLFRHH